MLIRAVLAALISVAAPALAEPEYTHWPNYQEGDFIIPNYKFVRGETLPQLKLHYRTLGSAERNAAGEIVNGVLLLQGNTGTGANWLRPTLADELFKDGRVQLHRNLSRAKNGSTEPNRPSDCNAVCYLF